MNWLVHCALQNVGYNTNNNDTITTNSINYK